MSFCSSDTVRSWAKHNICPSSSQGVFTECATSEPLSVTRISLVSDISGKDGVDGVDSCLLGVVDVVVTNDWDIDADSDTADIDVEVAVTIIWDNDDVDDVLDTLGTNKLSRSDVVVSSRVEDTCCLSNPFSSASF